MPNYLNYKFIKSSNTYS